MIEMPDIVAAKGIKCSTCSHEKICKLKNNMMKYSSDIFELEKLMENKSFRATLQCEFYRATSAGNIR